MSANTYGRQVVEALTNKSGGGVVAGDVVVIDTTNNDAFTTTTTGSYTGMVGIAQETIASNAVGRVLTAGYAALVNVNASVTRGHFGKTHTVVKQATDAGASRVTGCFLQFLTGGTTPDAHVFGMPDGSSASGNVATDPIWTAAGDIAVGTGASTAAVVGIGAVGGVVGRVNGVVAWNGGTSFPGSKATGDRFWRSDLGLEFYWDGTRWVSTTLYHLPIAGTDRWGPSNFAGMPIDTTNVVAGRSAIWSGLYDLWLVDFHWSVYVLTTNTGSAYWTVTLNKESGATTTAIVNPNTSALSANAWTGTRTAIGAVLGATNAEFNVQLAKTGSPGSIYVVAAVTYRLIGT